MPRKRGGNLHIRSAPKGLDTRKKYEQFTPIFSFIEDKLGCPELDAILGGARDDLINVIKTRRLFYRMLQRD